MTDQQEKARRMYDAAMTAALAVAAPGATIAPVSIEEEEGWEACMALLAAVHLSVHLVNRGEPGPFAEVETELADMLAKLDRA